MQLSFNLCVLFYHNSLLTLLHKQAGGDLHGLPSPVLNQIYTCQLSRLTRRHTKLPREPGQNNPTQDVHYWGVKCSLTSKIQIQMAYLVVYNEEGRKNVFPANFVASCVQFDKLSGFLFTDKPPSDFSPNHLLT